MLVLERKIGQRIIIDGPCVIEVLRAKDGRAKLGITADRKVNIRREELEVGNDGRNIRD